MPISLAGTLFLLLGPICYDVARAQQAWQVQWEETVRAAEREGRVVIYGDNTVESLLMTVVINWFLSREGQTLWLEYLEKMGSPQDPIREDVPKDKVHEANENPEPKYFNTQKYDLITNTQPMMDLIKRSLEESKKP